MSELETLAAIVHASAAAIHGVGVVRGELSPSLCGAAVVLHGLAIAYNARRGNLADAMAHGAGVLAARSRNRALHAALSVYDGLAAIDHARCAMRSVN